MRTIKYFSPLGKDEVPSGVYFQKGGFIHECHLIRDKFLIPSSSSNTRGPYFWKAITVLPHNANPDERMVDEWSNNNDRQIGFRVGKFIVGKYGETFNRESVCFAFNWIKWRSILAIEKTLLTQLKVDEALIKNLDSGKIYLLKK